MESNHVENQVFNRERQTGNSILVFPYISHSSFRAVGMLVENPSGIGLNFFFPVNLLVNMFLFFSCDLKMHNTSSVLGPVVSLIVRRLVQ